MALAWHPDLQVLAERPLTGDETLAAVAAGKPDVALIDYWMDIEGPALTRLLGQRTPETKVLLLSWFHGAREIENALEAGAVGFLPRSLTVEQVVEAIRKAQSGQSPVFGDELAELARTLDGRDNVAAEAWQRLVTLTDREILILRLLSLGHTANGIASRLFISTTTSRKHIDNIIKKLEVHSQLEAIALGRQSGLVQL